MYLDTEKPNNMSTVRLRVGLGPYYGVYDRCDTAGDTLRWTTWEAEAR